MKEYTFEYTHKDYGDTYQSDIYNTLNEAKKQRNKIIKEGHSINETWLDINGEFKGRW